MKSQPGGHSAKRYVIGVAGGTGAGKTTLADAVAAGVAPASAVVIHEDRYYRDCSHLEESAREGLNFDHPESLDLDLLADHVRGLLIGKTILQPVYDFVRHIRKEETVTIAPARFLIVEGLFTLYNRLLQDVLDFRIFLDVEEDIRLSRRIERDTNERGRTKESVIRQWNATVKPMHEQFIQPCQSRADLVIPGSDRVEHNVARMRDFLASKNVL